MLWRLRNNSTEALAGENLARLARIQHTVESKDTVATCLLLAVTSSSYSYCNRVAGRVLRGMHAHPRLSIFRAVLSAAGDLIYPCLVPCSSQLDVNQPSRCGVLCRAPFAQAPGS